MGGASDQSNNDGRSQQVGPDQSDGDERHIRSEQRGHTWSTGREHAWSTDMGAQGKGT
jgi:hypothetical protein